MILARTPRLSTLLGRSATRAVSPLGPAMALALGGVLLAAVRLMTARSARRRADRSA